MRLMKILIALVLLNQLCISTTSKTITKGKKSKPKANEKIPNRQHSQQNKQKLIHEQKKQIVQTTKSQQLPKESSVQVSKQIKKGKAKEKEKKKGKRKSNKKKIVSWSKKIWNKIVNQFKKDGFVDGMQQFVKQSINMVTAFIIYLISLLIYLIVLIIDLSIVSIVKLYTMWPSLFYTFSYIILMVSCFYCCQEGFRDSDQEYNLFYQSLIEQDEDELHAKSEKNEANSIEGKDQKVIKDEENENKKSEEQGQEEQGQEEEEESLYY